MTQLQEGDIVLCTVEKIAGTMVFVKIDETGEEGSIVFSEVAPGRIRNIRNYVVPKKKIVCKVLRIRGDQIHLSLRRVSKKEEKEAKEQYKQERSYKNMLISLLGEEKAKQAIEEIKKQSNLPEFIQETKENPEKLGKLIGKENTSKILEKIEKQKKKQTTLKKEFILKSENSDGITQIKEILGNIKDAEVKYISSGRFSIKTSAEEIKNADKRLKEILENIEKQAKKKNMEFAIKEK